MPYALCVLAVYGCFFGRGFLIRGFCLLTGFAAATIAHLNLVGTQMLVFNHRFQEYAKNFEEEALRKDRLRFTSDLHDSCGYVFTNIIAMSDAAINCAPNYSHPCAGSASWSPRPECR